MSVVPVYVIIPLRITMLSVSVGEKEKFCVETIVYAVQRGIEIDEVNYD